MSDHQHYETSPERVIGRYSAINGGSKPPNFLQKLFDFLSLEPHPCPEIIYWASDSKQLVIAQPDRLAKEVLPKLFKHDKIASFGRQLNIYGFSRLFPGRQFKDSQGNISDASVWAHPTLNRLSSPSDLLSIKRRAPPKLIRTRRLANGEIIRTKAGPGVIEKARQIKEAMMVTKTRERSSLWNKPSQSQTQTSSQYQTHHTEQHDGHGNHEVKRNDTLLSDITEYSETDTHNNGNANELPQIQSSADTSTTSTTNFLTWPHVNLTPSMTSANTQLSPQREINSLMNKPLTHPHLILGERPYSSCPASIHTSPNHKHTSLPFRSTYNQFNTLTSSINSSPLSGTGTGGGIIRSFKPNLSIDTDANVAGYGYTNSPLNDLYPSGTVPLPQVQATAPTVSVGQNPPRIAAPAAPVPAHLLRNQPQSHNRSSVSSSVSSDSSFLMSDEIQGPGTNKLTFPGYAPAPAPLVLPQSSANDHSLPYTYNNTNSGTTFPNDLSSSWEKNQPTHSRPTKPLPQPMIFGTGIGNGTIDPRWVSPVGSEWSTPSITRVSSPSAVSFQVSRNNSIDTSGSMYTQQTIREKAEIGKTTPTPPFM
ncbi:hypothetical protein I302_100610 [Kwoniella bestiolae CBS 10118]|uniref:HSF-type DNA-binding domain-containing protein n=1 Tax=Kwoniella bestiolae CBS 10118 TaxID=1296100 RepID=A0A1B9G5M1_9TREE|nr:hypothetical protein I302_03984 [Kwoniella bestiolae CBS 10118]OCF26301.1 hypothetical protein I302_03984 [Kwoniella bestiolae CBS 10118]